MSENVTNTNKKSGGKAVGVVVGVLMLLVGAGLVVVALLVPAVKTLTAWLFPACLWGGIGLAAVGLIVIVACGASISKAKRKAKLQQAANEPEVMADVEVTLDGTSSYNGAQVSYIASEDIYQQVNMGRRQTEEQKFDEIAKMDRTQFVIYMARLFSQKGYQVQFTPVLDNHDVDIMVQKMGINMAVCCILTNKVLCEADIRCALNGKQYYKVDNTMVITNMYFDRTALNFAKANQISLVDRNLIAEDFMN